MESNSLPRMQTSPIFTLSPSSNTQLGSTQENMRIKAGERNFRPKTNTLFPMKTALRNLLFSVLIITSADAQNDIAAFDSGTVIVVEHLQDEVIIATDSRLLTENNVAKDTCKIKTYKNIGVFAASGSVHFSRTPDGKSWLWDANRTAMEAFQMDRTAEGKEDKATRAATIWGDRGSEFF